MIDNAVQWIANLVVNHAEGIAALLLISWITQGITMLMVIVLAIDLDAYKRRRRLP